MSGSVNGMAISNDGSKFYTGGDDKVSTIKVFTGFGTLSRVFGTLSRVSVPFHGFWYP